jgi:hypothetical protein
VRRFIAVAVALVCTLLPIAGQLHGDRINGWLMVDFRAYYCAALAVRERANPYRVQPLHNCESSSPRPYYRAPANVSVPAPYPPYALAMISPLTFLPFATAAVLWWIILAISCVIAAYCLARVTQLSFLVAWAALALSLGLASFPSGQLVPVCVAALLVAARLVQRGRLELAVIALVLAMVEPHIALPAAVAFFIRYAAMRPVMLVALALLVGLSLIFGGVPQSVEYFARVLPAHALAEVSRDNQYSLATVLASLRIPDALAVLAGSLSYVVMAIVGIVVALRLARRYHEPAFLTLMPPAIALLGGTFVHTAEIAAAVPAALLLFARAAEYRNALIVSVILLAVPWMSASSIALFLAPLFPIAYLAYMLSGRHRSIALGTALASLCAIAILFVLAAQPVVHSHAVALVRPAIDPRLAEAGWRTFVLANSTNRPVMWLLRLPTWIGLILLVIAALALSRKTSAVFSLARPA